MQLNESHIDALTEIINIGVGKAANILNMMTGNHISLQIPEVKILDPEELLNEIYDKNIDVMLSSVNLSFKGSFSGNAKLIFPTDSASILVSTFTQDEDSEEDFDSIRAGTLSEIGNVVLNSLIGTICNLLKIHLNYSPPNYIESHASKIISTNLEKFELANLFCRTRFLIEKLEITGDFVIFFEIGSLEILINLLDELIN